MWSVGSAVVKMKRSMISVRDDDLSNFKIATGGARQVRAPARSVGWSRGVFLSTRRVASQCNPSAAHVPVGGETF